MTELLQLIETLDANDASPQRLFGGEGTPVRSARRGRDPREYNRSLLEAARFVQQVYEGRRPVYHLKEALGTADFPLLFGDIIDRQLLGYYRETVPTYRNYMAMKTVPDFRTVKRFAMNGSEAVLLPVAQQEEYPESKMTDLVYQYSVNKYGRQIPFSWEAMVNDDLDALKDIPARFGRACRRSEEKFATQLMAQASGPNPTFYSASNKNQVITANGAAVNNSALSVRGLQDGMKVLNNMVDVDGEPILVEAVHLVVPPSLDITAKNILHALQFRVNELAQSAGSQGTYDQIIATNWMSGRVTLWVNYYLPLVDTTTGTTAWYLFADPNTTRPAFEFGFLRGHTEPELFMKEPTAVRIGGGGVNPMDGDFDTDSIRYKVRHVFGGVAQDPRSSVVSLGTT